jgi:ArsR family transcriptional regulator
MKSVEVAEALRALSHEHRLAIFRLLIVRGLKGLSAGDIANRVGLVPSSLTFHLQNLQRAGLITRRRESRQLFYTANFAAMNALIAYLTENCCAESGAQCGTACIPTPAVKPVKRVRAA